MRRSLLAVGLVTALVASFGLTAGAQVPSNATATVDVTNILAGTANKEFKITITNVGNALTPAVNFAIIATPIGGYTIVEGRSPGWDALIISDREVAFQGGSIAGGSSATFSMFTNVPVPPNDIVDRWVPQVSSNGGQTMRNANPATTGALDTTVRVLQVTSLSITAPPGATDNSVTGAQTNADAECRVQNVGSSLLSVDATFSGANFSATDTAPQSITPGGTGIYTYDLAFNDVTATTATTGTCSAEAPGRAQTGPFSKSLSLTIQPRAVFDYVGGSVSPKVVPPGAAPNFAVRVNKHQTGTATTDGSPAVTLEPSTIAPDGSVVDPKTDFKFDATKTTPLSGPVTVNAGLQNNVLLSFTSMIVPQIPDGNYDITLNVAGTDANGAPVIFRPVPNVLDKIRVDFSIPVISNLTLSGPQSRCCAAGPAVRNGDALTISGLIQDRDPGTGQMANCGTCQIVRSELVQGNAENGGTEIGSRIPVTCTNTAGTLSCTYSGSYDPATKSVRFEIVVKDEAGNLSAPTTSGLFVVDNVAPVLVTAAAHPAPTVGTKDLQRQLRVTFSEKVDNFNAPMDGVCPGPDWRADNNTVFNCIRDPDFQAAGLLVTNQLPADAPGLGSLTYFPNLAGSVQFHDRVGLPIQPGTSVQIVDRIPPRGPIINQVAGKAADADDGRFYTKDSTTTFRLINPPDPASGTPLEDIPAVKAGYTGQLWRENGKEAGLQVTGVNADDKIGEQVAGNQTCPVPSSGGQTQQVPCVTITGNLGPGDPNAAAGVAHTIYARSLDTAEPPNPTPANLIQSVQVVLDIAAPLMSTVVAMVDRIQVTFTEVIKGRDFASDWRVLSTEGFVLNRERVEGTGTTRDVVMNDSRYFIGRVGEVRYRYIGLPNDRYRDRAGNLLADFTHLFA